MIGVKEVADSVISNIFSKTGANVNQQIHQLAQSGP